MATEISTLGEFGLIERLTKDLPRHNDSTLKGVGDDAAVLSFPATKVLVTTDLLLENVHFDLTTAYGMLTALPRSPFLPALGYRAAAWTQILPSEKVKYNLRRFLQSIHVFPLWIYSCSCSWQG